VRLFAAEIPSPARLFRKWPALKSVAVYVGAAALTAGLAIPTFSVDRSGLGDGTDRTQLNVTKGSPSGEESLDADRDADVSSGEDVAGDDVADDGAADDALPQNGDEPSRQDADDQNGEPRDEDGGNWNADSNWDGDSNGENDIAGHAEVDQKALTQQDESRADRGSRADRDGRGRDAVRRDDERAIAAERDGHQVNANGWTRVRGIDISSFQPSLNWDYWWRQGKRFASIKATEGTNYISDTFDEQWEGAGRVGMLRTAYHFALPDGPSGAAQAKFFVANGGGGKADGRTLPGVLDIEFGEAVGRPTCYNLSAEQIVDWTDDFLTTYENLTGRKAIIYTNRTWWEQCTSDSKAFGDHPLWLASYNPEPGEAPGGWKRHTIWQYTDRPIDQNYFSGSYDELKQLARR
jgi:GH25 family lysozyme M1 (1,4-beta-N-acetylmuramidase)